MVPLVSVIVPTYNQSAFVEETVASVLAQDHPELQVVITDDGSSDGTIELLRAFESDPRVTLLTVERNTGISSNFNRGLAAADGELIAWLGGDDVMLPGKITAQVAALERRPDAVCCIHDAEVFEGDRVLGRFSELYNGRPGVRSGGVELQFDPSYFQLPSASMFRASAAPAGGFDERLRFGNDWLWFVELLHAGPVVALQDVLVRYRRHGGNVTADEATKARILEEGLIACAIVTARYPDLRAAARSRATAFLLADARELAARGDRRGALSAARTALATGGLVGTTRTATRLVGARRRRGGGTPA
jgi:glycosyltransferase involved in cell wall biosynthesis